jgi:hypothetical protein
MSTIDPEDAFRELIDSLPEPDPEVTLCTLTDLELIDRFQDVTDELFRRHESMDATTEVGRDLLAQRAAYKYEMERRKVLRRGKR